MGIACQEILSLSARGPYRLSMDCAYGSLGEELLSPQGKKLTFPLHQLLNLSMTPLCIPFFSPFSFTELSCGLYFLILFHILLPTGASDTSLQASWFSSLCTRLFITIPVLQNSSLLVVNSLWCPWVITQLHGWAGKIPSLTVSSNLGVKVSFKIIMLLKVAVYLVLFYPYYYFHMTNI